MAVQGSINSGLGKQVGVLLATLIVHAVGTGFALLQYCLPFLRGQRGGSPGNVPWYLYVGGVLGVGIVYLVAISIARLGVAVTTTLIIVGQVGTALLIDELGLFGLQRTPFTWLKGAGLLLLAAGAGLLLRK
jgi:transporter family-2 protein